MDRYVSLKFQGVKSAGISMEHISTVDKDDCTFLVDSQSERGIKYLVDMTLGVCSWHLVKMALDAHTKPLLLSTIQRRMQSC